MSNKIIFFDLDGTLRTTKSGKTFINEPHDQRAIEGTQKAVAYYQEKGFVLIGITNQGGVAAGHKSLESAIEEQRITLQLFPELREVLMCTSYDGQTCWSVSSDQINEFGSTDPNVSCRKPGCGMILVGLQGFYSVDIGDCWMIGDRPEDEACALAAGIKFIWASVLHAKFTPGMKEIECQHIEPDVLMQFLSL